MKSRILKMALTLLAPIVIEFVIKKITGKREVKNTNKQIPSPH
ncbi:hypothetical protein [Chryseobacterium echinoideorum]|nr:hypothetical protein [Chryseobacterium echinoideorum]